MKKLCLAFSSLILLSSCTLKNVSDEPANKYYVADFSTKEEKKTAPKKTENKKKLRAKAQWYRYVRFDNGIRVKPQIVKQEKGKASVIKVPLKVQSKPKKVLAKKGKGWVFNTKAKYTIQYTSTPRKELASKLKIKLEAELGEQAHLYMVRHNEIPFYVVYAGEFNNYSLATRAAKPKSGWVRKLSVVRAKRCDNKDFLIENGSEVWGECE